MRKPVRIPDNITPRDFQQDALDGIKYLVSTQPETWHLLKAPTGSGKSLVLLMAMQEYPTAICITPRLEIISGMLEKLGYYVEDEGVNSLVELAANHGIFTPIRLRNWLAQGKLPWIPDLLLVDECHHDIANTYQDITMYLNGVPKVGLTASDYRGTPKGTAEFRSQWGNQTHEIITLRDCLDKGYCRLPTAVMWPLVDDDYIEVSNGEMKASSADAYISDRLEAIVDRIKPMYCRKTRLYDKSTMIALPTTNLVNQMVGLLNQAGLPAVAVTQATKRFDRNKAFTSCVSGSKILVQIDVVSEGVDLQIKRLIDARATMSPVKWVQQIGRIMRPGGEEPEYICCCRNLERHCYLMQGMFPATVIKEAQEAFGGISKRSGIRAIGLEELGKFKSIPVETTSGITVSTYNLVSVEDYQRTEYFVLAHPGHADTVKARRIIPRNTDGSYDWRKGHWQLIDQLPNLKGFASATAYPLTEKQTAKWNELSERLGLNPFQKVDARKVQILFFLRDTHQRLA